MEGKGGHTDLDGASLVGETIAHRWRVVRLLGRGGMCSVYEAQEGDGTRVALKLLRSVLARNPRTRVRFLREERVAQAVGHPNAVRVLDSVSDDEGRLFLVMELLEGETLAQRRIGAGGRLARHDVLRVAAQVLEVLAAAHAKAIFHRDIKPENIFVTVDGTAKVLDFGIAALRDEALDDEQITQSGVSLGTPAFMAPEQARGRHSNVDARTDIWAVGATMFFCLSGRHVHGDAGTANEALIFSATQPAPALRTLCPDVPEALARVVDRALALEPSKRWQSADAMRAAIASATLQPDGPTPDPGGESTQDETPPAVPRVDLGRRPWWPATAMLLACALVAGALTRRAAPVNVARESGATAPAPPDAPAGPASSTPGVAPSASPVESVAASIVPAPSLATAKHARIAASASGAETLPPRIPDAILDRRK